MVREILDELFGPTCHVVDILVKKKGSQKSSLIDPVNDYLLWYSKTPRDAGGVKFRTLFARREMDSETLSEFLTFNCATEVSSRYRRRQRRMARCSIIASAHGGCCRIILTPGSLRMAHHQWGISGKSDGPGQVRRQKL